MNVEGKKRTRKACVKKGRAVYVNMDEEISKVFAIDRIFRRWLMLSILLLPPSSPPPFHPHLSHMPPSVC